MFMVPCYPSHARLERLQRERDALGNALSRLDAEIAAEQAALAPWPVVPCRPPGVTPFGPVPTQPVWVRPALQPVCVRPALPTGW